MKELVEPITIENVKKITDDMFTLGPNVVLRFNVECSRNVGNKTYPFYSEYEYPCDNGSVKSLVSVKRVYDYYMSIENVKKDDNGNKVFVRIGVTEILLLQQSLAVVASWFSSKKYANLFVKSNGVLTVCPPVPNAAVTGLPMGKYLEFYPTIIDRGMANADKFPGIRIYLGDDSAFIDIPVEKFMGFKYIVDKCDMFGYAQNLANAMNPELGFNRTMLNGTTSIKKEYKENMCYSAPLTGTTGITGRKVENKNNMSSLED